MYFLRYIILFNIGSLCFKMKRKHFVDHQFVFVFSAHLPGVVDSIAMNWEKLISLVERERESLWNTEKMRWRVFVCSIPCYGRKARQGSWSWDGSAVEWNIATLLKKKKRKIFSILFSTHKNWIGPDVRGWPRYPIWLLLMVANKQASKQSPFNVRTSQDLIFRDQRYSKHTSYYYYYLLLLINNK